METIINSKIFNENNMYLKYIIATFAKEFFKDQIKNLDKEHKYNRVSIKQGVSKESIQKFKDEHFSKKDFENFKEESKNIKEIHPEIYRIQTCLPSSNILNDFKPTILALDIVDNHSDNYSENTINIENYIQGYKGSNEILKSIENKSLDEFCTETIYMIKNDMRDVYNKIKLELLHKYHLLSDDEIKNLLPLENVESYRISLNREKCKDFTFLDKYYSEFITNYNKRNDK